MKQPPICGFEAKRAAWQQAIDAWYGCGRSPKYAAEYLGINHNTMQNRIKTAQAQGFEPRTQLGEYLRGGTPEPQQAPMTKPRVTVTAAMQSSANRSVLVISDLHAPYQHPDALRFLAALKEKYRPDLVVNIGDELDYHAASMHDSDPDLDSAGRELQRGREVMWELEALFPRMDLVDSNHGSLIFRRALKFGLPRAVVLDYRDQVFSVKQSDGSFARTRGDGWRWHPTLTIDLPNGSRCTFAHGRSISTKRNVEQAGMSFVQGHHHGTFEIVYHGTPDALNFGMTVGCLIDDHALAFAYNKNTIRRPIIGCGIILDGLPKLLPMPLAKGGRWTGVTP